MPGEDVPGDARSNPAPESVRRDLVEPPPVQMNSRRIALFGTTLWFVAFVVLLFFWTWLGHHGHRIWLWTSLAGWLLGLLGSTLVLRHRGLGRTS